MARTTYITIPEGLDIQYKKAVQVGDRFVYPHVKVKRLFTSRSRKKGLTQKSLMVSLGPVWESFTLEQRESWNLAGAECGLTGWKLFVQDTSKRIANELPGYATPSTLYQSMVGRITIESPAVGLTIMQLHPQSYYILRKVSGTRSQYEPKLITENLSLPVDIAISFKSDFESIDGETFGFGNCPFGEYLFGGGGGGESYIRFFIIIYSSYQGRTIENLCNIDIPLSSAGWERLTASINGVVGLFRGYNAFIEIHSARGTLLFDNVDIVHGGVNWARDPFCNSIQTTFTKAYYQIPRNWIPESIETGAFYRSVYHDITI